jgi:hypothetical protein
MTTLSGRSAAIAIVRRRDIRFYRLYMAGARVRMNFRMMISGSAAYRSR